MNWNLGFLAFLPLACKLQFTTYRLENILQLLDARRNVDGPMANFYLSRTDATVEACAHAPVAFPPDHQRECTQTGVANHRWLACERSVNYSILHIATDSVK